MNSSFLPSKMLILLVAACLAWIGLLSLGFVLVMGTGISAGWIFGGTLFLAVATWVVVIFGEIRNSIQQARISPGRERPDHGFPSCGKSRPTRPRSRTPDLRSCLIQIPNWAFGPQQRRKNPNLEFRASRSHRPNRSSAR